MNEWNHSDPNGTRNGVVCEDSLLVQFRVDLSKTDRVVQVCRTSPLASILVNRESRLLTVLCFRTMRWPHTGPIFCQTLQMGYTQKRLESSPACFWKYRRKYKANYSFVCGSCLYSCAHSLDKALCLLVRQTLESVYVSCGMLTHHYELMIVFAIYCS